MADLVTLLELNDALNLGGDTSHDAELARYISAVTAHVERRYGVLPAATVTEVALVVDLGDGEARLMPSRSPVSSVTSITRSDGTSYTTGFTITADRYIEHDNLTHGRWTIVYTSTLAAVPADLKLAVLEDIRGLYQPGQIGPPAAFGAFGIESTEVGTTYRPVRMWPRVDAWLERDPMPGFA